MKYNAMVSFLLRTRLKTDSYNVLVNIILSPFVVMNTLTSGVTTDSMAEARICKSSVLLELTLPVLRDMCFLSNTCK